MSDRYEDFLKNEIGQIDRNFNTQGEENKLNMRIRKIMLEKCLKEYQKVKDAILKDVKQNVKEQMNEKFRKKLQEIGRKIVEEQY
ncbi:MAG: hypothetical protein WC588_00100 [Candidatus Micrarchaeia archaeon]